MELTRQLMHQDRTMLAAELANTDEAYATFIRDTHPVWLAIKKEIAPIVATMQRSWKTEQKKQPHHYVG